MIWLVTVISPQSLHLSARQYRDEILGQHYLAMVRRAWIMAESEWDDIFDKNTIQDYNVLSAEINRLFYLKLILYLFVILKILHLSFYFD